MKGLLVFFICVCWIILHKKCSIVVMYDGPLETWHEKSSEWRAMTAFLNSGQVF